MATLISNLPMDISIGTISASTFVVRDFHVIAGKQGRWCSGQN